MTVYRQARTQGKSFVDKAQDTSENIGYTQFDCTANNSVRAFSGNWLRVLFQFKHNSAGITYLYANTLKRTFKPEPTLTRGAPCILVLWVLEELQPKGKDRLSKSALIATKGEVQRTGLDCG